MIICDTVQVSCNIMFHSYGYEVYTLVRESHMADCSVQFR